jgi:hypothetical protein
MKLVVDANVFISALIGGKAAELLFNPDFELITTERTTWEVKKYLPKLAGHTGQTPSSLLLLFELIPVKACQSGEYERSLSKAQKTCACNNWSLFLFPLFKTVNSRLTPAS